MPGFHTLCCATAPTSTPPAPPPRAGLWYRMSTVRVESPDGSLVDDTESELTFTLPEDSYVIVLYNASNMYGSVEFSLGKFGYVNVDGVDMIDSWCGQTAGGAGPENFSSNIMCTWAGRLPAGTHTVKGRFGGNAAGYTVGVDARQIVVLAVPVSSGPLAFGVSAFHAPYAIPQTPAQSPIHGYPVEDPHARLLVNLESEANVLAIYRVSKRLFQYSHGWYAYSMIYVDGMPVPESRADQSTHYPWSWPYGIELHPGPLRVTSVAFKRLGPGVHTLSGRFANTEVAARTLAYIVAPKEWVSTGRMSSVRVEGNGYTMRSPPPWDDPEAVLTFNLTENSLCLALYSVSNNSTRSVETAPGMFINEAAFGKFTLINVDGVDMPESFASQSIESDNLANSVLSLWAGRLTAGSHTIKGRWGSNELLETTGIDRRVIAVICIPESLLI